MKAACKKAMSIMLCSCGLFEYNDRITRRKVREGARAVLNRYGYQTARIKCDRGNNGMWVHKKKSVLLQVWIDGKEYKFELKVMI